jgi:hypothetical protein
MMSAGTPSNLAQPAGPVESDPDDFASDEPTPPSNRIWISGDYLYWWVKNSNAPPPLITTGPPSSLGLPTKLGTIEPFSGSGFQYDPSSGVRATAGLWADDKGLIGFEGSGFVLARSEFSNTISSDATGTPLLSRPIFNALTGAMSVSPVAFPGALSGSYAMNTGTQLWGAEANFIGSLIRRSGFNADMVIGARYVGLDEDVTINTASTVLPAGIVGFGGIPLPAGNTLAISDHFATHNDFYGAQIGVRSEICCYKFYVDMSATLGLGDSHSVIKINGNTSAAGPVTGSLPGGLLAVASNSGTFNNDHFGFLPETKIKIGFRITEHVGIYAGYNFLLWTDVLRPVDQMDVHVNPHLVPSNLSFGTPGGPIAPTVPHVRSDFWAQGVDFGVEVRF